MTEYEIVKITEYDEISHVIQQFDNMFIPSLTSRVSSLHEYTLKLKSNAAIYLVKDINTIGFIAFYVNNSEFSFVTLIAVLERYRKRGIGKILLEKCFEISREKELGKVRLEVSNNNTQALKLYKNLGFTIINNLDTSYIMEKSLL